MKVLLEYDVFAYTVRVCKNLEDIHDISQFIDFIIFVREIGNVIEE